MVDLDALGRADLFRLILEQQGQIDQLRKQVEELRQAKGSAAPFSKGKQKENPKRPGRKPGQGIFRRRSEPPDGSSVRPLEIPVPETQCPFYGAELERELPDTGSLTAANVAARCGESIRMWQRANTGPALTVSGRGSRQWLIPGTTVTEFRYGGCRRLCGK